MIGAELTMQLVVMRFFTGLLIAALQGFVIAGTAVALGDKGPRYDGRFNLNPFRQVDLFGLGAMMLSGFGWSRQVAVDHAQLRFGRWGVVLCVLASNAALLILAFVLPLLVAPSLTMLPYTAGITIAAFLRVAAKLCVWMAIFTLLPLPPLAGGHLLNSVGIRLPAGRHRAWRDARGAVGDWRDAFRADAGL